MGVEINRRVLLTYVILMKDQLSGILDSVKRRGEVLNELERRKTFKNWGKR